MSTAFALAGLLGDLEALAIAALAFLALWGFGEALDRV